METQQQIDNTPPRPASPFISQDQRFPSAQLRSYKDWNQHKYGTQHTMRTQNIPLPQLTHIDPPRTFLPWFFRPPEPGP